MKRGVPGLRSLSVQMILSSVAVVLLTAAAVERWVEEQPDLIVLDVNMPRLDGFAVCRRIRKQADTPIILLTVRGEEDDIVHGLKLGADDYITKPFSPRQLRNVY